MEDEEEEIEEEEIEADAADSGEAPALEAGARTVLTVESSHSDEEKKLTCWSDGFRLHGDLVFLSLFGGRNAVRAVWARLLGTKYGVHCAGHRMLSLAKGVSYATVSAPFGEAGLHMTIVHPTATLQVSPWNELFYVIGEKPEEQFFGRLNQLCPVPFRPEWAPTLWQLGLVGLEREAVSTWSGKPRMEQVIPITPLAGAGMPGFMVQCDEEVWRDIVVAAVKRGDLR